MIKLSTAQAAVLAGEIEWNSDGSAYVTTGRENTLASLRKLGFLHGSLLTEHGNDARVSVQSGTMKVTTPENGESNTFYSTPVAPAKPTVVKTVAITATDRYTGRNGTDGNKIMEWFTTGTRVALKDKPMISGEITGLWTVAYSNGLILARCSVAWTDGTVTEEWIGELVLTTPPVATPDTGKWDAVLATTSRTGFNTIPEYCTGCNEDHAPAECNYNDTATTVDDVTEADVPAPVHVIDYPGTPLTGCDKPVRLAGQPILRVSVDPSDVTCPECSDHSEQRDHKDGFGFTQNNAEDETETPPLLMIDMSAGRTATVTLAEHTMTIRNGSDVRLRAAFWARGLGYRSASGRGLQWQQKGKLMRAAIAPIA